MNTQLLNKVEDNFVRKDLPEFSVGDTIAVHYKIRDDKDEVKRVQVFKGIVLAIKNSGTRKTFTIRKIGANGIGVERIIPLNSPNIDKIEILKKGKVRRSKIYYMRDRIGRSAMKITDSGEVIEEFVPADEDVPEYVEEKGEEDLVVEEVEVKEKVNEKEEKESK